jgi:hypothetical protein
MRAQVETTRTNPPIAPQAGAVRLQRACACGHQAQGGEFAECSKKRDAALQRASVNSAPAGGVPPVVHEVLRSSGRPLDPQTRAFFEPRFGHDGYGDNVAKVRNLVSVVGEDALQRAFFRGDFGGANRVLGPCGMERWSQLLQMFSERAAEQVLNSRNQNYCEQMDTFPTGATAERHGSSGG